MDDVDGDAKLALAVLAFSRQPSNFAKLASTTSCDEAHLRNSLGGFSFLEVERNSGVISFVSESHRRHAEKLLEPLRRRAIKLQIDAFRLNPTDAAAIRFLPTYLEQAGEGEALLQHLSPDHYLALLRHTNSTATLRQHAGIGVAEAITRNKLTDVLKYSFQKSIFKAIGQDQGQPDEVRALISLGQPDRALSIASQAVSVEARLALLATYAREVRKITGGVDSSVLTYIRELVSQIDLAELGERATEIASDLAFVDLDLAMSIIDEATRRDTTKRSRDIALARMTIAASLSGAADDRHIEAEAKKKISDERLSLAIAKLVSVLAGATAREIIDQATEMEPRVRLVFLRSIVAYKPSREGVLDLVEYALESMVKDSTYRPKAADLADLARPLVFVRDNQERALSIAKKMESQLGLIETGSATRDLVAFEMRLAQAEYRSSASAGIERLLNVYYDLSSLSNRESRAEGFALMLRFINSMDKSGHIEKQHGIKAVVKSELTTVLGEILDQTADHFVVVKGALAAIVAFDPEHALSIARGLNTQDRRDQAFAHIAATLVGRRHSNENQKACNLAIDAIASISKRDEAVRALIGATARNSDKGSWLSFIESLALNITDACISMATELDLCDVKLIEAIPIDFDRLQSRVVDRIPLLDSAFETMGACFRSAYLYSQHDKDKAIRLYELGAEQRKLAAVPSVEAANLLSASVRLVIRASDRIISNGLFSSDHMARTAALIDVIPCARTRSKLYAEFACRAWCTGKSDVCREIVRERINPLLAYDDTCSPKVRPVLTTAFPAMYLSHSGIALTKIDLVPQPERDQVILRTIGVILRKLPPSDPVSRLEFQSFSSTQEDIRDVVNLLSLMLNDTFIYSAIELIAQAMSSEANTRRFTQQQRTALSAELDKIIRKKLPDGENIRHDGYKIISLAQSMRLGKAPDVQWDAVISSISHVPNASDRVYMKLDIASCLPAKLRDREVKLVTEVLDEIEAIPSAFDRAMRFELAARLASYELPELVQRALRSAMMVTSEIEDRDVAGRQVRDLIDIADRVRDGLGDELIELIDDDPARAAAKDEAKKMIAISQTKRSMASGVDAVAASKRRYVSEAAWGNFEALVNGRIVSRPVDRMLGVLQSASDLDVREMYPVLAWYIENVNQRFRTDRDASKQALPVFEAILLCSELAVSIFSNHGRRDRQTPVLAFDPPSLVVLPAGRESALEYLRQWLRVHGKDYVKICDPYFGPNDVGVLRIISAECPGISVKVVTGHQKHGDKDIADGKLYRSAWARISDELPPETEILVVTKERDGTAPMHDRWILTPSAGLRVGTSWDSIGDGKVSELSQMDESSSASCEKTIDSFLNRTRTLASDRLLYEIYTL